MDVESRLGRALDHDASTVRPDVAAALRQVHAQDRRRTVRRRVTVAAAVVAVLVAAGVAAQLGAPFGDRGQTPVSPPRQDDHPAAVSLSTVRERSASSLGLERLIGLAVSPDGRVYVTDDSQQVAELGPDLDVVRRWGRSGTGPGELRMVQGSIAVGPDGDVYVADTGNFRVQVFAANGRYLRSVGEFGTALGQFNWPFDLVVDDAGNVYLADDKQQTLTKLSPSGRPIWRRGGTDETDPRLVGHEHLTMIDAEGRLLVTNDDAGVVMLLDPDGTVVDTLDGMTMPAGGVCDATVDPLGRYYLSECFTSSGLRVYLDGEQVGAWVDAGVIHAPRWDAEGHGYAVTADGGVVEMAASTG